MSPLVRGQPDGLRLRFLESRSGLLSLSVRGAMVLADASGLSQT